VAAGVTVRLAVVSSVLELRTLVEADLDDAADLLAARHTRHRVTFPALAPSFEEREASLLEIRALWEQDNASGGIAVRDGRMTAFMIGVRKDDTTWGPNVWIDTAGHAASRAEDVRDLYGLLAEQWVADGRSAHTVVVPASDPELVDTWFRLGFGHQHVHGIRDAPPPGTHAFLPPGLVIRPAERGDLEALAVLDLLLPEHQARSPVFSRLAPSTLAEAVSEWEEDWDDERSTPFVAERDGVVVGSAIACAIDVSSLHQGLARPPGAGFLGFAVVAPEARGGGVGRALGEAVLQWARDAGHATVVVDWRMTNLLSSRIWPRLGFEPTFFRLHRTV
jgi:GNAT superfamily N-acetyltransferase